MKIVWFGIAVFLEVVFETVDAQGYNDICGERTFMCACGQSDFTVEKTVKLCRRNHPNKIKCKPCDGEKNKDMCEKYRFCEQCYLDGGDSCLTCPEGRFGAWCQNRCPCHNGGICERNGRCICPETFEGEYCEIDKGYSSRPKCPVLSAPANGRLVFSGTDLVEGTSAEIECVQGYRLRGQQRLTCLSGGRWDHDLPLCENLSSCPDPGIVDNADRTILPGATNVGGHFLQNSELQYKCQPGFEQIGVQKILCTFDGTWSDPLPTCLKVDACSDPPTPIGGFVTFLPPLKTSSAQRSAIQQSRIPNRASRVPVGLAAPIPQNTGTSSSPKPVAVSLPPGLHRLGTRAMYDCESRYYKLIGSRTRRCQEQGEWSGRPPTCMPVCGRSDSPRSPFIVNGNVTDIGQWPWQAGIARFLTDYDRWFLLCGASLLSEKYVITAAHCVTYAGTTLTIEADKFQVYLGKYHRTDSKDDEYVQVRKIQEIHVHPDYDPGLFDADVALLQLDSPVQLNSRVQPICLPSDQTTRENLVEGKKGVVTGWGMNENDTYSEVLQQAVLPVVSNANCEKGYEESELPLTVTDNMFCAGYAEGKTDACSGDSGGPVVFLDESSKERKWVLEGIVSWGSPRGCGNKNQYGGFTIVSRFLDWIHLYF